MKGELRMSVPVNTFSGLTVGSSTALSLMGSSQLVWFVSMLD